MRSLLNEGEKVNRFSKSFLHGENVKIKWNLEYGGK